MKMMIDGIPNRPLYFYQKDIIESDRPNFKAQNFWQDLIGFESWDVLSYSIV